MKYKNCDKVIFNYYDVIISPLTVLEGTSVAVPNMSHDLFDFEICLKTNASLPVCSKFKICE